MQKRHMALLMTILLPLALRAEGFWVKKDYGEWSARECAKLLQNSPWSKMRTFTAILIQELSQPSAVPGREHAPQISYVAMLWSALPVRQAVVRQAQLDAAFLRLPIERRQALEAQQVALLQESFADRIVIRMEYATNARVYERELATYWQSQPEEFWKQKFYLNTSGGRHSPLAVRIAPGAGGSFELVFARAANGEPFIRAADKSFSVDFDSPAIGAIPGGRALMEFKLKDMMIGGRPIF